jgi:hypothetical protein
MTPWRRRELAAINYRPDEIMDWDSAQSDSVEEMRNSSLGRWLRGESEISMRKLFAGEGLPLYNAVWTELWRIKGSAPAGADRGVIDESNCDCVGCICCIYLFLNEGWKLPLMR